MNIKKEYKSNRLIAAIACLAIVIIRIIFPQLRFDEISFWLVVIFIVLLVIPDIGDLVSRIKKLKKGDLEIEFERKIDELLDHTVEAEEQISSDEKIEFIGLPEKVQQRIQETLVEPRATLINIAVEIESRIKELSNKYKTKTGDRYFPTRRSIKELVDKKLINPNIQTLFNDFWAIRNEAVHSKIFIPDKARLFELADLGIRILHFLYMIPGDKYELLYRDEVSCPKCGADVSVDHSYGPDSESASAICEKCGWRSSVSNRL